MKKISGLKQVSSLYKNFFFDLDGVIWKGNQQVPGSVEILNYLRKENKNLYFITNSSIKSREGLIKKFGSFDFKANIEECFPSSYMSTIYLKEKYPEIKKVMILGTDQLAKQFQISGFQVKFIEHLPSVKQPIQLALKYYDSSIQAVVVGWTTQMTFIKQCYVGFYVQKGVKFFGTNPDKFTIIGDFKVPGAGTIINAIETGANKKAEIVGKPNTFILEHILKKDNLNRSECIMIGDNRQTDIQFGNNGGISTLCVLSGVTTFEDIQNDQEGKKYARATYYSNCIFN